MAVKNYRTNDAGRRISSVDAFSDITKSKPEKSLIFIKKEKAGRNSSGKITVRHRGGGRKRFIRIVDFRLDKYDMPAEVLSIEYDPNRNARIALVRYEDGEKRYILSPEGLKTGEKIINSKKRAEIKTGNRMPLRYIPLGVSLHNIELFPGKGGEIVRSAGSSAVIQAMENNLAQIKLPSGEIRMVPDESMATVGQVSNPDYRLIRWGKAGRIRLLGIRPSVRGKVMNPVDHPHGGGEGKNPIGMQRPKTPWGKPALGPKTRKRGKKSDKFILKRRRKK